VVVDVDVVVDLVVDGDGDGDGSAAQLGQHRNDPGKEFDRLPMLAFLKAPEGTDDVEHRSAFHGRAASVRVVSSGVRFGASSRGLAMFNGTESAARRSWSRSSACPLGT
jgi:hypothetical protein